MRRLVLLAIAVLCYLSTHITAQEAPHKEATITCYCKCSTKKNPGPVTVAVSDRQGDSWGLWLFGKTDPADYDIAVRTLCGTYCRDKCRDNMLTADTKATVASWTEQTNF